ncbi:MAG: TerB family tellurite resistance protein [Hyphomicrobiales bacterium]
MFERLIESIGIESTGGDAAQLARAETQLAAAILLFAIIPADRQHHRDESLALHLSLRRLFPLPEDKARKLVARAAAQYGREPTLLAPATLLKHRLSEAFRRRILLEAEIIAMADGSIHEFERDVLSRMERLLGLIHNLTPARESA